MRDQLKRLEDLQKHDARIQEIENTLKAIPLKLAGTENDLARVEGLLASERSQLSDAERYYDEQKGLLNEDETQVGGAKHKLSMAKNSKEYMAAQREIEQKRESAATREAEISKLREAAEAKRRLLAERAADVDTLKQTMQRDSDAAQKKMAELQGTLNELRSERDQLASGVRPDILKRYSTIRMRRGLAVVAVQGGTCTGCNMNIPPQLYNVLQRGNSLETCPSCHRIIYWDELMKEPAGEGHSDSDSSAPGA